VCRAGTMGPGTKGRSALAARAGHYLGLDAVARASQNPEAPTSDPAKRSAVFIEDFVDVALALSEVRPRICDAGARLAPLARAAEADGESFRADVGPFAPGGPIRREVRVVLGPVRQRGDAFVVPVSWAATSAPGLFPILDGDVELVAIAPARCRLTLSASYTPPLGGVGRALDWAVLHRLAQSTIRSFLSRVAAELEGAGGGPPSVLSSGQAPL